MKQSLLLLNCILFVCVAIAQSGKLILPVGHTDKVTSGTYSPDGKKILTSSVDFTTKIWNAETGQLLSSLKGHTGSVSRALFSPNGTKVLTISNNEFYIGDSSIRLWDALTGELIKSFKLGKVNVVSAQFNNNGSKMLLAFQNGALIWDIRDTSVRKAIAADQKITGAAFRPNSNDVVTITNYDTVSVWNIDSGKRLFATTGHKLQIASFAISPDGSRMLTGSYDSTVRLWDLNNGSSLQLGNRLTARVSSVTVNNDGTQFGTSDGTVVRIWDIKNGTGTLSKTLEAKEGFVHTIDFSPSGNTVVTTHEHLAIIWDLSTGKALGNTILDLGVTSAKYNPDGTKIIAALYDAMAVVINSKTYKKELKLEGHTSATFAERFSPDGKLLVTSGQDGTARIWDLTMGKLLQVLRVHKDAVYASEFSKDGSKLATASKDNTIGIWDVKTGSLLQHIKSMKDEVSAIGFDSTGTKLVSGSSDGVVNLWNVKTGQLIKKLFSLEYQTMFRTVQFSPDNTQVLIHSFGGIALVDLKTGKVIQFNEMTTAYSASFSKDGKKLITVSNSDGRVVSLWDAKTGKKIKDLDKGGKTSFAALDPGANKVVTISADAKLKIWDGNTGALLGNGTGGNTNRISEASFSPDGSKIITVADGNLAVIYDANTGERLHELFGHEYTVSRAIYSPGGDYILTNSDDNTLKVWDTTGKLKYSFFAVDTNDYLLYDAFGRYDGTQGARNLLYYTCGTEIIELSQLKDLSWEPGLAGKIMRNAMSEVRASRISDSYLCDYIPIVTNLGLSDGKYKYTILERNGGLGLVQVFVNGSNVKQYLPSALSKSGNLYTLEVNMDDLKQKFVSGITNKISVKANCLDNTMTSRGGDGEGPVIEKSNATPNMYIVAVGINQYKEPRLKLNYASHDAESLASALNASAKKLLESDNTKHVFTDMYTSMDSLNKNWPAKQTIKNRLEEIAKTATADDIMVFFFAGHGVLQGGSRNLYLLAADAADFVIEGVEDQVAISTDELIGLMAKINAGKKIMILDACNSGQFADDLQGNTKREVPADNVRALEKLKDNTGSFILCASASGKPAFETSQFGQGLLTYSLLSGIKLGNGLRDNKFIDVTNWFANASENVKVLAREIGGVQDPRIIGSNSFDVGLVDDQVVSGIQLSTRKKIMARSRFIGDLTLLNDQLNIAGEVDRELNNIALADIGSAYVFIPENTSSDVYQVTGRYDVKGKDITVSVNLLHQNAKAGEFITKGTLNNKAALAKSIAGKITGLVKK
jgi:WD40 repeat protein